MEITAPKRPTATRWPDGAAVAGALTSVPQTWPPSLASCAESGAPSRSPARFESAARSLISHETIYRRIRWDKRIGGDLWRHTRIMSKFGRKRYRSIDSRGVLPGKRHISERPPEVALRKVFGHWEGDTVIGQDKHHSILTLVERMTGFTILKKLSDRNTCTRSTAPPLAPSAATVAVSKPSLSTTAPSSTTTRALEQRFPVTIYFATPYHSWERGSNENLNGLLRQYLPRGTCFRHVTQAQCDHIADDLNHRPRKRLDFDTPAQLYHRH